MCSKRLHFHLSNLNPNGSKQCRSKARGACRLKNRYNRVWQIAILRWKGEHVNQPPHEVIIRTQGLTKSFKGVDALKNLNLTI